MSNSLFSYYLDPKNINYFNEVAPITGIALERESKAKVQ